MPDSGSTLTRRHALTALCALCAMGRLSAAAAQAERRIEWTDVTLIDGRIVRADALRAQAVVVEIWATWCPFCKKQNPHLQKLQILFHVKQTNPLRKKQNPLPLKAKCLLGRLAMAIRNPYKRPPPYPTGQASLKARMRMDI